MTDAPTHAAQIADPDADRLLHEVGALVVTDPAYRAGGWIDAAIVFNFVDGRKNAYGYVFRADGTWEAQLPDENDFAAIKKMVELQGTMQRKTGKKWHRALVHLSHPKQTIDVKFEYDDPTRWTVNPGDLEASVTALRP